MLQRIPKGKLMIIGGAEDKGDKIVRATKSRAEQLKKHLEILKELLPAKRQRQHTIEIITTASTQPDELRKIYRKAFRKMGFAEIGFIHMYNNQESQKKKFVKRLKKAHAVLFTGGDQFRLATIMGNSECLDMIIKKYQDETEFVVAGTSAGAMALARLMMYREKKGSGSDSGSDDAFRISAGLGLIDHCIIDTHFSNRGRFGRLAQAIVMNSTCIGIGLSENTALVIRKGNKAECRGTGMAIIIDGTNVQHTNVPYVQEDEPVNIENLTTHILCEGTSFLLNGRKFIPSKEDLGRERAESKRKAAKERSAASH